MFTIRRNTLPYIYQYAVIDDINGEKLGDYKTKEQAELAIKFFKQHGVPEKDENTNAVNETAYDVLKKRIQNPLGNSPPTTKSYSTKRRVELDE